MKLKHYAKVNNGKMKFDNYQALEKDVKSREGKEIYVTISEIKNDRSHNQNRYYWGVVLKMISEETGDNAMAMHEAMKYMFLTIQTEPYVKVRSTTDLSTKEFEEYLDNVRRWAFEFLQMIIPLPNECEYDDDYFR